MQHSDVLKNCLGKAIFAFTATRQYAPEDVDAAFHAWLPQLERALTDTLPNLAESYGNAVRSNPRSTIENVDELVDQIKQAAIVRNVLCHASWSAPDVAGKTLPLFVNRKLEKFETHIDKHFLVQVQRHVAELICAVVDTVTYAGMQFPGSEGPGEPIWTRPTRST